jgi:hypothetical protein
MADAIDPTEAHGTETEAAAPAGETRKKRKTSRGLREAQKVERRATKAAHRLAEAVTAGLSTYRKDRDRSAEKKRDGALRDMPRNVAKAAGKTVRKASRVPSDLVRAVDGKTTRRLMRIGTRFVLFPFSR